MNKSKILFLITSNYPFGKFETFIENEINTTTKYFDKVVIMSQDNFSSDDLKRSIPESIDLFRIKKKSFFYSFLFMCQSLFNFRFVDEILHLNKGRNALFPITKIVLKSLYNSYFIQQQLREILKRYPDYNSYFFYSYWMDDSAIAISQLSVKNKSYYSISRAHKWDVYFEENPYSILPFRRLILKDIDQLFTISLDGQKYLTGLFPDYCDKISLSRLGVNKQVRLSPTKDSNNLHLLSCSYIRPDKRLELIIATLSHIKDLNIYWTHIGEGSKADSYRSDIKELAKEKLHPKIQYTFLGDLTNQEVLRYYQSSEVDIFINLSSAEGIPVTIMEAMSFGIPVLATDVGGTREIVNNENGFLLSANPNIDTVTAKIKEFYNLSIQNRDDKSNAAFNTWKEYYDAELNYSDFYKNICQSSFPD